MIVKKGPPLAEQAFHKEFRRTTIQRILTGEKTIADLSRELGIAPSVIRNWTHLPTLGQRRRCTPASQLREPYAKIRELERAQVLRSVSDERRSPLPRGCPWTM